MADFVCVGDVAQDNFFFIDEAGVHCGLNKQNCTLEIAYGQKIPVQKYGVSCGGNAANVATGLSRLGVKTELVTLFGGDQQGNWLKRKLLENGVGLESCVMEEGRESNVSSIIIFKGERTILTYHAVGRKTVEKIPEAQWFYLTAATEYKNVLDQKGAAKLAFNPAAEDLYKGKEFLQGVVDQTDVLLLNKDEFAVVGLGPKVTVVTDGRNGADLFEGNKMTHFDAIPSVVLETTGAGDAFSSGFLAGLFYGQSADQAMVWGMKNASAVVTKLGAQEGLLTRAEICEVV